MTGGRVRALLERIGPVPAAFAASLLLSWVAAQGRLLNRDGIYYLDTARTLIEEGFGAAMRVGEWNFLPLLIAALAAATPLGLEAAARTLDALLLAGACALLVDCVRRRAPEAAWAAVLVALAMPAYNQYRGEILREYGFWFFSLLAFWLAMRRPAGSGWRGLLASQFALLAAALFRLEAVAFFAALMLWRAAAAPPGARVREALAAAALPIALALPAALLLAGGAVGPPPRLLYYLDAIDPRHKAALFEQAAARLADLVLLTKYSREEAVYVLVVGLLAIIPVKFLKMSGLLLIPFVYGFKDGGLRKNLAPWQPLPWAFAVYALVLAAFVTHLMFLTGRYVSMLNLLAVPLAAVGFARLAGRHPRWRPLLVALALLMAVANAVSLSPPRTQIPEAGNWLRQNAAELRVGMETSRIAYYAGWKLARVRIQERQALADALAAGDLDLAAFEIDGGEAGTGAWLAQNRLAEVRRFAGPRGAAVILAAPARR